MSPNPLAAGAFGAHLAPSAWTDTLHTGVTYKKRNTHLQIVEQKIFWVRGSKRERIITRPVSEKLFLRNRQFCCKDYPCTEQCVVQLMIIEVLIFSGVCASKQSPAFTST